jgi:hypothetical protein
MRPDDLDSGGYQPSTQYAAPDLSTSAVEAAKAAASGSQNSYEVIIENIDLNLYKEYAFVFSYILANNDPKDTTIVVGPPSPRFVVTQAQVAAAIPDYTEAPTNVVATGGVLSYQVTWDKPTWINYTDTIIWEGTSSSFNGSEPVVWTGTGTQANILASSTDDRYIKILHRDKFFHSNTSSANKFVVKGPIKPVDPIVVDITGPPAVGSATVSGGIDPTAYLGFNGYANITWSPVTAGDIRGYRIRFKPTTESVYSYADSPGAGTSYKLEGLSVGVTYEFAVATYDQYNNTTSGYVNGGTLSIPGTPVMTGYISAGEFKFGDGVVSGKRGLLFNSSNYWYINSGSTAEFKVGGPTSNYIKWDGSTLNIDGNIGATGTATIGGNINLSTSGASIYNGTINTAGTLTGNGFALNSTGLKVANGTNSVTLDAASGTITANAGSIGNWSLSGTQIFKNNAILDSSGYIQLGNSNVGTIIKMSSSETASSDGNTYRMWIGSNDPTTAPFKITSTGKLYGTGVVITGDSSFSGTLSIGTALSDGGTIGDVKTTANSASTTATSANNTATSATIAAQTANTNATTAKNAADAAKAIADAALPSTSFDGDSIAAKINSPTTTTTIDGGRLTTGTIRANAVVADFISAFSINADKITAGTIGATISITTPNITVGSENDSYYFKTNQIRTGTSRAALGLNNVNMISANSAGMLSNWYPYNNDDVSLGIVSPFVQRWRNIFLINNPNVSSDLRLKKDISETSLGLDFIKSLKPVQYKLKARSRKDKIDENGNIVYYPGTDKAVPELNEDDPGNRYHYGFIAQEVKGALDLNGVGDQAGLWAIDNLEEPDSTQALVYSEFISPLTKAIQELSNMVESLQQEVNTLKGI